MTKFIGSESKVIHHMNDIYWTKILENVETDLIYSLIHKLISEGLFYDKPITFHYSKDTSEMSLLKDEVVVTIKAKVDDEP